LHFPRVRRAARSVLGVLWELPQTALGAAAVATLGALGHVEEVRRARGRIFVRTGASIGVSLGHFVLVSTSDSPFVPVGEENADHEYGHAVQSRRLGPLYLPLVGVPSVARVGFAVAHRILLGRRWAGYYRGYPESEADRLGSVRVGRRPRP
jgi:hypothetical protein